jgi:protein-disulfide isomerase
MRAFFLVLAATAALAAGRLVEGNPQSAVRVVIYEDLQCGDCAAFRRLMDSDLLPRFGAKVAFEHRDFPLAKHSWARRAAIAARFFESLRPELAVAYRRETLEKLKRITPESFEAELAAFAKANGVDPARAVAALADPKLAALVEADYQEGVARGIAKTPTVFVNGEPFIETIALDDIAKSIEREIAANPP